VKGRGPREPIRYAVMGATEREQTRKFLGKFQIQENPAQIPAQTI